MLTQDDLVKMSQIFVTKEDLRQMEERFDSKYATKDELRNYATLVEKTLGELKNIRQEEEIHAQRHDDIEADLREIKSIPVIAHELKKKAK
jgi:hypothetical protein